MLESILGLFLRAFGNAIADWLTKLTDGLIRDQANRRQGASDERNRARTAAEIQEADAAEAARAADRQPLDADDGFRSD
jgi:hypothetical protein